MRESEEWYQISVWDAWWVLVLSTELENTKRIALIGGGVFDSGLCIWQGKWVLHELSVLLMTMFSCTSPLSSVCTALVLTVSSPVSVPSGVEIAATVCQTPC